MLKRLFDVLMTGCADFNVYPHTRIWESPFLFYFLAISNIPSFWLAIYYHFWLDPQDWFTTAYIFHFTFLYFVDMGSANCTLEPLPSSININPTYQNVVVLNKPSEYESIMYVSLTNIHTGICK